MPSYSKTVIGPRSYRTSWDLIGPYWSLGVDSFSDSPEMGLALLEMCMCMHVRDV